jgi:Asp/Glu/hydantoin racemase
MGPTNFRDVFCGTAAHTNGKERTLRIAAVHPSSEDGLPADEIARRDARRRALISRDTKLVDFYNVGNNIFNNKYEPTFVANVVERIERRIADAAATEPDAIVVLGGIEPGVRSMRQRIRNIPIIGTGQATYNVALQLGEQLGHRLGVIVYEPTLIDPIMAQARYYKVEWMISGMKTIDIPTDELYPRRAEVRQRLLSVGRELVEQGATMVFAQGLSMVPSSMSAAELSQALHGVPVLDGEAIALHTAEMFGRLRLLGRT